MSERTWAQLPLYGVAELAIEMGVTKQCVSNWKARRWLPSPIAILVSGPVWDKGQVDAFKVARTEYERINSENRQAREFLDAARSKRGLLKLGEPNA